MDRFTASEIELVSSTAVMSVRWVMISVTVVSSNSKILAIISLALF